MSQGDGKGDAESLLRDYAGLSGSVMQLAAYMMAEPAPTASIAGDENVDRSNVGASGLLSPRAAALALKHGSVGAHLVAPFPSHLRACL